MVLTRSSYSRLGTPLTSPLSNPNRPPLPQSASSTSSASIPSTLIQQQNKTTVRRRRSTRINPLANSIQSPDDTSLLSISTSLSATQDSPLSSQLTPKCLQFGLDLIDRLVHLDPPPSSKSTTTASLSSPSSIRSSNNPHLQLGIPPETQPTDDHSDQETEKACKTTMQLVQLIKRVDHPHSKLTSSQSDIHDSNHSSDIPTQDMLPPPATQSQSSDSSESLPKRPSNTKSTDFESSRSLLTTLHSSEKPSDQLSNQPKPEKELEGTLDSDKRHSFSPELFQTPNESSSSTSQEESQNLRPFGNNLSIKTDRQDNQAKSDAPISSSEPLNVVSEDENEQTASKDTTDLSESPSTNLIYPISPCRNSSPKDNSNLNFNVDLGKGIPTDSSCPVQPEADVANSNTNNEPDPASFSQPDADGRSSTEGNDDDGGDNDNDLNELLKRAKEKARMKALEKFNDGISDSASSITLGNFMRLEDEGENGLTGKSKKGSLNLPLKKIELLNQLRHAQQPENGLAKRDMTSASNQPIAQNGSFSNFDRVASIKNRQLGFIEHKKSTKLDWHDLPVQELTKETKMEIQAMRLHQTLDPKSFLKGGLEKSFKEPLPTKFLFGHVIDDVSSLRRTDSARPSLKKRSFVESLLEDDKSQNWSKKKYAEQVQKPGSSGGKLFYQHLKEKRLK